MNLANLSRTASGESQRRRDRKLHWCLVWCILWNWDVSFLWYAEQVAACHRSQTQEEKHAFDQDPRGKLVWEQEIPLRRKDWLTAVSCSDDFCCTGMKRDSADVASKHGADTADRRDDGWCERRCSTPVSQKESSLRLKRFVDKSISQSTEY